MKVESVYMDYAATSPMTKQAIKVYSEVAHSLYGNSSSLHDAGGRAHYVVEAARKIVAEKIGVHTDGIIFTGSGTEGNILAILSLARSSKRGNHIITSMAEHTSVHAAMNTLEREGFEVTKLPFTDEGIVDVRQLQQAIRPDTSLISIQHVNSEIGSIQPIAEISKIAVEANIPLHVDCVQSFCKLSFKDFIQSVDAVTVSAHKIGGPKGCGAVYINPKRRVVPMFPGVTHEKGLRGGTLDTPSIVSMAAAIEEYQYQIEDFRLLRKQLKSMLHHDFLVIEADEQSQLPSILGICLLGVEGQLVLLQLNEHGIYISTGSACDINSASGTKAILAMGYSFSTARQFFRISFGSETTMAQVEKLANVLNQIRPNNNKC